MAEVYSGKQMADTTTNPSKDLTKIKSLTENDLIGLRWLNSYVLTTAGGVRSFKTLYAVENRLYRFDPNATPMSTKLSTTMDESNNVRYFPLDCGLKGNVTTYIKATKITDFVSLDIGLGMSYQCTMETETDTLVDVAHYNDGSSWLALVLCHTTAGAYYVIPVYDGVVKNRVSITLTGTPAFYPNRICFYTFSSFGSGITFGLFHDGYVSGNGNHDAKEVALAYTAGQYVLDEWVSDECASALAYHSMTNGSKISVGGDNSIVYYNARTDGSLMIPAIEFNIDGIALSVDGKIAYLSTINGKAYYMNVDAGDTTLYEIPYNGVVSSSYKFVYANITTA